MRRLQHPELNAVSLTTVLHALSDPVRLHIVRLLAETGEQSCGACLHEIPRPTMSHHFKVLREAGVIWTRLNGTQRCISLRSDIDARFPGLIPAVLQAPEPH
jgi:DNA-binding transcriptional ArsR family regulator